MVKTDYPEDVDRGPTSGRCSNDRSCPNLCPEGRKLGNNKFICPAYNFKALFPDEAALYDRVRNNRLGFKNPEDYAPGSAKDKFYWYGDGETRRSIRSKTYGFEYEPLGNPNCQRLPRGQMQISGLVLIYGYYILSLKKAK